MDPDRVFHRDDGKAGIISVSRGGIDGSGSGSSRASPQVIRGNDKVFSGVDGLTGADHRVPPARTRIIGAVKAGCMGIAR